MSNVYGFYSITLPQGKYEVEYRYLGFISLKENIILDQDIRKDVELESEKIELAEIVVEAEREDVNITGIEMSTLKLDINSITKLPTFAGEVDVIKSLQLLPGVSTVGESASGFNVRGGGVGQNLILQDEAPVYQSSHLFGFFSVFNPDAVKDVKLYKGGIPAKFGGRISSILDIRMKEGNNKKFNVSSGVGTVFSRLSVEGPIAKEKASFIVAGRRSYADVLVKGFTDVLDDGAGLYFYDLTAKANYNINNRNRVYISGYLGRDVFKFDPNQGFNWGNNTATIRWNHLFNDKLFSNFSAVYSNYDYSFSFGENEMDKFEWKSRIITYNFKPEFSYFLNTQNEISFGADIILYKFQPANAKGISDGTLVDVSLDERKSLESSIYLANNQNISPKLSLRYGLRYSIFNYLGGKAFTFDETNAPGLRKNVIDTREYDDWESIQLYQNLEPRLSVKYQLSKTSSLKASYNRMNQYIHLISNTVAATPIDVWQPSTNNIRPQKGDQVALGYFKNLKDNLFETSIEVYYKKIQNHVDYIDGADIFINRQLEGDLLTGQGRAYGLETFIKKTKGRINGWISYTLGKTELLVDGINYKTDVINRKGNWYPTRYDQRHNLKLVSNYEINKRVQLSGIFTYITGTPTTFPTDRVAVQGYVIPLLKNERNNVRVPDYHRLDLSLTIDNIWRGKKSRSGSDYIVISIYNLYARANPFAIYFGQNQNRSNSQNSYYSATNNIETFAKQISILASIFPAISYNIKF